MRHLTTFTSHRIVNCPPLPIASRSRSDEQNRRYPQLFVPSSWCINAGSSKIAHTVTQRYRTFIDNRRQRTIGASRDHGAIVVGVDDRERHAHVTTGNHGQHGHVTRTCTVVAHVHEQTALTTVARLAAVHVQRHVEERARIDRHAAELGAART